ncbi:BRO family protein [Aggregatibacter actinomycetemcomitans]|uniref:BRO family protein n=1 Tax=Aggregatibacter actinomycetemcomitans TaxID=714 RepID=UPI0011D62168|nr:BRO family protein [Aggregatibacter actinomycetemcomitans]TYA16835.1 hypothetical protein FXE10_02615 [Aggregatibacter actinomycetemcomitans]TYA33553.1 hypothetical protein FXB69_02615 [Aggregatibacter actinomycetemcomitans]TYB02298.1 hypothetical protein FXB93_02530 [Aggregatibacter actinomycetemcomitans]TYB17740.1 hypothetical protein FXB76_01760 [Aggregatibacter actinomycetemcomitans]TYB27001.1 hypothetical protein FXB80_01760 [Aggregatibacter actinomycetemcomitans]
MSDLQIFNFNSNPVRVELFDNQPHFCLLDVCEIFEIQNSRRVQSQMLDPQGVRLAYILAKDEKKRRTAFINEPNLYRIIFRSEKPIAKNFQNWVFEEVLPQIRKTGQYQLQQPALPAPEKRFTVELTEYELQQLVWLWFAFKRGVGTFQHIEKAFTRKLASCTNMMVGTLGVSHTGNHFRHHWRNDSYRTLVRFFIFIKQEKFKC